MSEYQISRFLSAVIARNGPLLDPHQVAAIRGCSLEELDRWVQGRADEQLAEFAVWLHDRSHEMEGLPLIEASGVSPAVAEYLRGALHVDARTTPIGQRWPLPDTGRYRAKDAADGVAHLLGRGSR